MLLAPLLLLSAQTTVTIVEGGRPVAAQFAPSLWKQESDALVGTSVGNFLYADARLGDGYWKVTATISLDEFGATAASIVFDSADHFGFDGRDNRFFVEGPHFTGENRPSKFLDLRDLPEAGKSFTVTCENKDGTLTLSLNGEFILLMQGTPKFRTVALRPHRATMRVYEFTVEGDVRESLMTPGLQPVDVFVSGQGGYHTYRIPSLTAAPNGDLLAFCEGRKNGRGDSGNIDLLLRRSADGGKTWLPTEVVWDDGPNTCGNPCVVVDKSTRTVHLLMTRNFGHDTEAEIIAGTSEGTRTVWITSSKDDGKTWTKPKEVTRQVKQDDWTWYATGPGAGIQIEHGEHKGRLVVPCDHIEAEPKKYYSHVIFSDDGGETWTIGGSTPTDQTNECEVVELSGGQLLLNSRNYDRSKKTRQVSISNDSGLTWIGQRHDLQLIEPICQASVRRISFPEPRAADGGMVLFSNPASQFARRRMTVKISRTDARSWQAENVIYEGPAAYSCLARAGDLYGLLFEADEYGRIVFVAPSKAWSQLYLVRLDGD